MKSVFPTAAARWRTCMTVDVFTEQPFYGNPVSVVIDGDALSHTQMLSFTRWTHLSEATFVMPPTPAAKLQGADYRVRIFSPEGEMDFAGHPTLGSCHAWLAQGNRPQSQDHIVQECAAGLIRIRHAENLLAFAAPQVRHLSTPDSEQLACVLRALKISTTQVLSYALLDIGTPWLCIQLAHTEDLRKLQPSAPALQALHALFQADVGIGLCALPPSHTSATLHVRAFTLSDDEDPVTGSLNACLAHWLARRNVLHAPYIAHQGQSVQRNGMVHISQDTHGVSWIGGECITCIKSMVLL